MTTAADVLKLIKEKEVKFVDLRFTDTKGKEQHVTVPTRMVDESFFEDGKGFDGSSIAGWKGIQESDMILMPDAATAVMDPFYEEPTLLLRCDVIEPSNMQGYERDPRSLAKRGMVGTFHKSAKNICRCTLPNSSSGTTTARTTTSSRKRLTDADTNFRAMDCASSDSCGANCAKAAIDQRLEAECGDDTHTNRAAATVD